MRPKRAAIGLLGVFVAALVLGACGGDSPPSAEPATPQAPASEAESVASAGSTNPLPPTEDAPATPPTTAEVLLRRATQLQHDGFWEDAADARRLALSDPSANDLSADALSTAYLAQIAILLQLGQPSNAAVALAQMDQSPGLSDDGTAAGPLALIRGRVRTANANAEAALAAYNAYLKTAAPAKHIALLERARLQTALGDSDSALRDYTSLRNDPATPPLELESALLEGGLLLENEGRYAEADDWYLRLGVVSPWRADDTFALHRSGAVRLAQDDTAGAAESWTALLAEYPGHWRSVEAYDGLLAAGLPPDPLVEGLFLYRQSRLDDAVTVYTALLTAQPPPGDAGIATYYLAAIDEDLGKDADAVDGYLAAVAIDPAGPQADDALWWAARLMELDDSNTLARLTFARLATEYPDSVFATEAAFRAPLAQYRMGDLQGAADGFRRLTAASSGAEAQRAGLWLAKSLDGSGDRTGAHTAYQDAAAADPNSYHGLRARAQLAAAPLSPQPVREPIPADPLAGAPAPDAWLNALAPARQEPARQEPARQEPDSREADRQEAGEQELGNSLHWQAGLELWAAGLTAAADARFRIALAQLNSGWALFQAGQIFNDFDAVHLRLAAGVALLERVPAAERAAAPAQILRWAYPRGWPDLAATAARNFHIDELLLYALIRQESRFNPAAGSVAGALGLTQVIPATGAEIARTLDDPAFQTALLFRPERSIRYGAAYLGAQLTNFDQAAWIALAAYNGGPASAAAWSDGAATFDPDLFYEQIRFPETRAYLRLVLENYAWYQFIYRTGDAPTIVTAGP